MAKQANNKATKGTAQAKGKATTGAKVGKLVKGKAATTAQQHKAAPAKGGNKAKGAVSAKQAKARGQFAGKRIAVTPEGKAMVFRGGAAKRAELIMRAQPCDAVLGTEYTESHGQAKGTTKTINASDISYLVARGAITVS